MPIDPPPDQICIQKFASSVEGLIQLALLRSVYADTAHPSDNEMPLESPSPTPALGPWPKVHFLTCLSLSVRCCSSVFVHSIVGLPKKAGERILAVHSACQSRASTALPPKRQDSNSMLPARDRNRVRPSTTALACAASVQTPGGPARMTCRCRTRNGHAHKMLPIATLLAV